MSIQTERLRDLLGSEAAAQKFVDLFRAQLPAQLQALRNALAEGDWETASNTAHGLKSQCRYLGLDETADWFQALEDAPEAGYDLSQLDALERV